MTFQLIDLTLVGRAPEAEKDERHWRGKALMSLQSCSDSERFIQELYILTTKASHCRSVMQENFCHSLGLVDDERLNVKPRQKIYVWFLWVANVCDWGWRAEEERCAKRSRGWWLYVVVSHVFWAVVCLFYKFWDKCVFSQQVVLFWTQCLHSVFVSKANLT